MRVASIFCGCGGADQGLIGGFMFAGKRYDKLPFAVVYALDNDHKAVATYNRNFDTKATCAGIEEVYDLPDHDLLVGGFPCQSFSTVNPTKNPFDERGQLYKHMGRILKQKQPKVFIAENVKGMKTLMDGKIFERIKKEFEKHGYIVNDGVLNAADYGVPQKRQRVFIIGFRKDLGKKFVFPEATHAQFAYGGRKPWTPLSKVVDSLIPPEPKYYFSERAVQGMKNAKNNMKRGLAQDLSQPCLTVTSHLAKVSLNSRDPVLLVDEKKELYRRFTPREAARIQSFPDKFQFVGSDTDAYKQVGNAIPPVLMWNIAEAIAKQLGYIDCN